MPTIIIDVSNHRQKKSRERETSILTFKVRHNRDLSKELATAKQIANFAIKYRSKSTAEVKCFGLKAALSNQILRKYAQNYKCKKVKSVKLTVPACHLQYRDEQQEIYISCLKLYLPFCWQSETMVKINQVELGEEYAYISVTVRDLPQYESMGFVGVDLNSTEHLAVAAIDEKIVKLGGNAEHEHKKQKNMRRKLQAKGRHRAIKNAKGKEHRVITDINHKVSRQIVNMAREKEYGIKMEDLGGISDAICRQGKASRRTSGSWAFYQLQSFIAYKSKLSGVPLLFVDPAYTSQTCSRCGQIGHRTGKRFMCPHCGHFDHADANAAFNIAKAKNGHSIRHKVNCRRKETFASAISDLAQEATQRNKCQATFRTPHL